MANINKETSLGLLNKLNSINELEVEYTTVSHGYSGYNQFKFFLDDFEIIIREEEGPARIWNIPVASDGGHSYYLIIDSVSLKPPHKIGKEPDFYHIKRKMKREKCLEKMPI
jgi:hypothetical protein